MNAFNFNYFNNRVAALLRTLCTFLFLGTSLSACLGGGGDADAFKQAIDLEHTRNGCLQGALVDGITGKTIPVPAASATEGLYVLVRNFVVPGLSVNEFMANQRDDATQGGIHVKDPPEALAGEFFVCKVPLDEEYPVFAFVNGYVPFESKITIKSSKAQETTSSTAEDIIKTAPSLLGNIRLWPKGALAADYTFLITSNGTPVSGATVFLKPSNTDFVSHTGNFLTPEALRAAPISATTDANGEATFKAADLVLGLSYTYTVVPVSANLLQAATGNVVIGLSSASSNPGGGIVSTFYQYIELNPLTAPLLSIISSSSEDNNFNLAGKITFMFNRPFEFVGEDDQAGGLDTVTSTAANTVTTTVKTNVPNNGRSEQVTFTISGRLLTVTTNFQVAPSSTVPTNAERDLSVTYNFGTLKVRPTDSIGRAADVTLASLVLAAIGTATPTVNMYR